jgi:ABC-type phosphate transport system substrate-binding protein
MKNTFNGEAGKFISWIIKDGQQYAEPNGYIPLPGNVQQEMIAMITDHST